MHTYDSLVRQVDAARQIQRRERGAFLFSFCSVFFITYDSLVRQVDAARQIQRRERGAGPGDSERT
jgi:hypothetical protein